MTNEQKQLLLKDLCGRLPYKTKVFFSIVYDEPVELSLTILRCLERIPLEQNDIVIKPYLRPISSMPVEERSTFERISNCLVSGNDFDNVDLDSEGNLLYIDCDVMTNTMDWLNTYHFDYRGLIPMGLALEAPKDMYTTRSL